MKKKWCGFFGGHHYQPGPVFYAFGVFADKQHPRLHTGEMYEQTCSSCGDVIFTVAGSRRIVPESVQRIPRPTPVVWDRLRRATPEPHANPAPTARDDSGPGFVTGLLLGSMLHADHAPAPSSDLPAFEPGGGSYGGGGASGSWDSGSSSSSDSGSSSSSSSDSGGGGGDSGGSSSGGGNSD